MNTFLSEVADYLLKNYSSCLEDCTVVFPNKRAGYFLKKYLSKQAKTLMWSPKTIGLEDFVCEMSVIQQVDTLTLIFELYKSFLGCKKNDEGFDSFDEGFDSFYFFGEILLKDFEEVDQHLINPNHLFKYVEDDKELSEKFYFLDERQEKIIRSFWKKFFPKTSDQQKKFIETWKILLPLYLAFKKQLNEKKIGYKGHIYRDTLEKLSNNTIQVTKKNILFVGFNALTPCEIKLFKYFVQQYNAQLLWDYDVYYVDNELQEAGYFLRNYQKDKTIGVTFQKDTISSDSFTKPKNITATGVSSSIAQAKRVGEEIESLMRKDHIPLNEIAIVLPQHQLLFPVLNSLHPDIKQINVTIGYPSKETPLYHLLDLCLDLQQHLTVNSDTTVSFYFKQVIAILSHPFIVREKDKILYEKFVNFIKKNKYIQISIEDIQQYNIKTPVIDRIFKKVSSETSISTYLLKILEELPSHIPNYFPPYKKYLSHFKQIITELDNILSPQKTPINLKFFKALFKKSATTSKIFFTGEPFDGLQIMDLLETRNVDFKHVFILNANEGVLPQSRNERTFILYKIRKAYHLPTFELQDAVYAYLFFRLIQRAENIHAFYNTNVENFGKSGEISRFIKQIEWESPHEITHRYLNNDIDIKQPKTIEITKTDDIIEKLKEYTGGEIEEKKQSLSASAINTYMDCSLKFYFHYVLRLFKPDDLSEQLDAKNFGNVLHKTLELLYKDAIENKPNKIIEKTDFFKLNNSVEEAIKEAFNEHYHIRSKKEFETEGRNLVMIEIMKKYTQKILSLDEKNTPFEILGLENKGYSRQMSLNVNNQILKVNLKGIIDRIDKKDDKVHIVDYKTGKDVLEIGSIDKLFDRDYQSRNKAGFQALYYSWLYFPFRSEDENKIVPHIFNMRKIFSRDFDPKLKMSSAPINDVSTLLPEFEECLHMVLKNIFDKDKTFDQTDDKKKCQWCDFKGICERY